MYCLYDVTHYIQHCDTIISITSH